MELPDTDELAERITWNELRAAIEEAPTQLPERLDGYAIDVLTHAVEPIVAALVAAAEERGFDRGVREAGSGPALAAVRAEAEWRGAEKERERLELWMRMLAEETDRHGPGLRDLAADLRWAANRMAEELSSGR